MRGRPSFAGQAASAGAVEAALVAGADVALWLTTDQVPAVLDKLEDAVASGRLSAAEVDQAAATVARFKGACGT